ncbi:putative integral membrane protein [Ochromonadaceae sp. CCMP2298]|nr:putative integral membrane protein [Ochromonadaceae sp. CCMP2298]|mmetsp:Transcript_15007/g.33709  ORF Transcript_15007/g.33709 Transcript_15007/m.33709 type:complete len:321 (+) Transcript_15007:38-1000(+)
MLHPSAGSSHFLPSAQHSTMMASITPSFPNVKQSICKVPEVTAYFWICKVCATTVGETISDFFNTLTDPSANGSGLGYCAIIFFPLLFLTLLVQIRQKTYVPAVYWTAIVLMSICGTIFTDGLYDNLGLELWIQIIMFSFVMFACFYTWYRVEGTLAVHSINTSRREVFYWLTILFTFALGTAVGDYISTVWPVSFGDILALFAGCLVAIGGIWTAFRHFGVSVKNDSIDIGLFWSAYIMTRPLGAATGDFLGQNKANGGLGLGYGYTSLLFIGLIIILVCGLTYTGLDRIVIITPQSEADAKAEEEQDAYTRVATQEKV